MTTRLAGRCVSYALAFCLAAPVAPAETPLPAPPATPLGAIDVVLQADGLLIGQLVNPQGAPIEGARVELTVANGKKASTQTNHDGAFAFRGARGLAQLSAPDAQRLVRSWSPETAPPSATPAMLLVQGDRLARGQMQPGEGVQRFVDTGKRLMANPLFVAGAVATAVAIPVAIHNADDDDPAS